MENKKMQKLASLLLFYINKQLTLTSLLVNIIILIKK